MLNQKTVPLLQSYLSKLRMPFQVWGRAALGVIRKFTTRFRNIPLNMVTMIVRNHLIKNCCGYLKKNHSKVPEMYVHVPQTQERVLFTEIRATPHVWTLEYVCLSIRIKGYGIVSLYLSY